MKTAISFIFIIVIFSCNKQSKNCEGPDLDCSGIRCIAFHSYFEFRLIDKTTGEDLVFNNNPRYTPNDIKLYSDAGRTVLLAISFDNNTKIIQTLMAKEEMYLQVKGTDTYKLTVSFRTNNCCSNRVGVLWQDGQMICSCCPDAITLPIR